MTSCGYVVDTIKRTAGGLAGGPYGLDRLIVAEGLLYYAREIPADASVTYQETWLIPARGWSITRFAFHPQLRAMAFDWKLEPDRVEVDGPLWHVHDRFLDLVVYEGSHYDLEDADELADALATGALPLSEGVQALHALHALCDALRRHKCSGASMLREFARGLPQ